MDCSLLLSLSFFKDYFFFFFFFFLLLIYFYQTFCCCCLVFIVVVFFFYLFFFLSNIFSFLTGLSSLLGPLGFWHLALPVGVCSLECNNNNNNNDRNREPIERSLLTRYRAGEARKLKESNSYNELQ